MVLVVVVGGSGGDGDVFDGVGRKVREGCFALGVPDPLGLVLLPRPRSLPFLPPPAPALAPLLPAPLPVLLLLAAPGELPEVTMMSGRDPLCRLCCRC